MPFWTPATIWKNETVVIVGGGRSLLNFDWSVIKKYKVLVCNRTFLQIPEDVMDAVILCDKAVLLDSQEELQAFNGIVFLNLPEQKKWTARTCPEWAYSLERHYGQGLSDDGLCWNGNTGGAAINLALICGATKIYLLGFDMKAKDPKNPDWYRQDDAWDVNNPAVPERFNNWLETFPRIDRDRKLLFPRASVVNVNDDSDLDTFPKMSVSDFIWESAHTHSENERKCVNPENPSVWLQNPYLGFGDTAWMRPFLRILSKQKNVFIHTHTPEIFWDLPYVFSVRPTNATSGCTLRVQSKNSEITCEEYYIIPDDATMIGWPRYLTGSHTNKSIWGAFRTAVPDHKGLINGSLFPRIAWVAAAEDVCRDLGRKEHQRLVIVKPPTIRTEWDACAREPKTECVQTVIDAVRDYSKNAFILFVGDVVPGEEDFVLPVLTGADAAYTAGEIPFSTLIGLMSMSQLLVSGQAMFLPIGLALGVPVFTVFGGAYIPEVVVDKAMNLSKWGYVKPDPFCDCRNFRHASCNKEIPEGHIKSTINLFLAKHWR